MVRPIIPFPQELRPQLPTVIGNVDYQTLRRRLEQIDSLLHQSGLEADFVRRALAQWRAEGSSEPTVEQQLKYQQRARRALRCNLLRTLLQEGYRRFSYQLAANVLYQRFCLIDAVDRIRVPSKSELQRFAHLLPAREMREIFDGLLRAAQRKPRKLQLKAPLDLEEYFLDSTCLKANIHFPTDWVLLRDAVRTLMRATLLIRGAGLRTRMRSPEEFLREVNRRSIQMSQQARRSGSKRGRKNCQKGIETQVSVMENMLNELLEYARGETGSTVVLRRMAHSDFVRQTLPELQNELKCQGVNLVMENAPPSAPVLLDPVRLSHVYRNILSNARDAMPKGGTVTVRFREEEGVIVTEIEDGETGIAPEIAPMLFEPFATYGKSRGTGLGLSICERIVQSHSGSIRAFNSPKGGAVFAFSLPVREAKDSPETTAP